jgi:hypothetical protein
MLRMTPTYLGCESASHGLRSQSISTHRIEPHQPRAIASHLLSGYDEHLDSAAPCSTVLYSGQVGSTVWAAESTERASRGQSEVR